MKFFTQLFLAVSIFLSLAPTSGGGGAAAGGREPETEVESDFILPNEPSVIMKARKKAEWNNLEFRVFKIQQNGPWHGYLQSLDGIFVQGLEALSYKYAENLEIQAMLKGKKKWTAQILESVRRDLLEKVIRAQKFYYHKNVKTNSKKNSYDQLKELLLSADMESLQRGLRYLFYNSNKAYDKKTNQYDIDRILEVNTIFYGKVIPLEIKRSARSNPELEDNFIKENYLFPPNPTLQAMSRDPSSYIAIVYDTEEQLPVMNINIYPKLNSDGTKFQENRYISKNHSYYLIKALKGQPSPSRLAIYIHASALIAPGNNFFQVKPDIYTAMKNILAKPGFVDDIGGGYYQSNEKFLEFASENIKIIKKDMSFDYE